jgi:hypothetical protein
MDHARGAHYVCVVCDEVVGTPEVLAGEEAMAVAEAFAGPCCEDPITALVRLDGRLHSLACQCQME